MKTINHIFYIVVVLILVVYANLLFYQKSYALAGFGAPILLITPCTNGLMLTVGPLPSSGTYLLSITPPSMIYSYYSIKQSSWLLGSFIPGGVCNLGPVSIPVIGTISTVGTSL